LYYQKIKYEKTFREKEKSTSTDAPFSSIPEAVISFKWFRKTLSE